MRLVLGLILSILMFMAVIDTVFAAILPERDSEQFIAPSESMTVLRGNLSLCKTERPHGGKAGLSFIQLGRGQCPAQIATPIGWDRPEEESVSPGIPFKGKGL
ncbi:MAG: hypothetical protein OM95_05955 [Bdellovibrio sp. ArHS]|uniref:hypothetical protein n=1 Tax=Bdellovibrio sp. ArHS TaxID=1569284 RepID=UPI0005826993|nr:hypothetical protein [Bdellovibrio sp. ArHS]KHD89002.1 MAG: hypothetical protein OM95_05955 [Bdellovibrio sp. ArHS]